MQYINLDFFKDLVEVKYKDSKLFLVRNFLKEEAYTQLRRKLLILTKSEEAWIGLPLQEDLERKSLIHKTLPLLESIMEEMNSEEFLKEMQSLDPKVKAFGINVWWDTEGYHIVMHVDNEKISSAFQIYLGEETETCLGTSFGYKDGTPFLTIPYSPNFGYFFTNTDNFLHGLITKLPEDFNRFSLYAMGGYN